MFSLDGGLGPDRRHRTAFEQREGDDRDFPELDLEQGSGAVAAAGADGAKADGQSVERAGGDEFAHVARLLDFEREAAADIEAPGVLADLFPDADRLVRVVLIEQPHAVGRAAAKRALKRPGDDNVARAVGDAEQRGVTLEAVGTECGQAHRRVRSREAGPHVLNDGHVCVASTLPLREGR